MIGREWEVRAACEQLLQEHIRLLTLTGPGGSGKTHLALAVGDELLGAFPDGVWLVDLTSLHESSLVLPAIARVLGLQKAGRRSAFELLAEGLRDRQLLLVLDNCEHVLAAASHLAELLSACRKLKVLATSREPLRLRWEHELPVPPLAVPDLRRLPDMATLATVPSVQLFVERALAVHPSFTLTRENVDAIAALCVRLDGLPLALELAAARIKLLPVQAMLFRLEHGFSLLTSEARDRPARHRTLGEAVRWSYDLLDEYEQALFRRLSIFVGGCALEAIERVVSSEWRVASGQADHSLLATRYSLLDLLGSLVDKSLLRREETANGELRFRMLETIREFAHERLQACGEEDETARQHTACFLALAEQANPELSGPHQKVWLDRLELERENLRAAQRWAVAQGDAETTARLVAALWHFWWVRANAADAREWVDAVLPLVRRAAPTSALARALQGAGHLAGALGDYATCRSLLDAALTVARQVEDCYTLASVLDSLGRQSFVEGHYLEARALLSEGVVILREIDDRHGLIGALSHLGFLDYLENHQDAARATYREGLALAREAGDPDAIAEFLDNLGRTFHAEGDLDSAVHVYQEAEAIWREIGQGQRLAMALNNLGSAQILRGELDVARAQLLEALRLARLAGNRRRLAFILAAIATLAAVEGQAERAVRFDTVAATTVADMGASLGQPINTAGALHVDRVRQVLGVSATQAVTAVGRALALTETVDEALGWLAEPRDPAEKLTRPAVAAALPAPAVPLVSAGGPRRQSTGLTRRESEVATLIARGFTNRQIAAALVISPHTAERHVERILDKLDCSSRAEVAAWVTRHDLTVA
ncbi:MAG: tetratricopeptide repeat protein [Chloroflexota bacterium]